MTEEQFYEGLVRTIRYGDYGDKENLLKLLKSTYITYNQTRIFTRKSWQFYEDVELRIAPELKASLERHKDILKRVCYEIYEESEEYDIRDVVILNGTRPIDNLDDIDVDVLFEHQQEKLISEIRQAKYIIWVAVAWFTDPVLFEELKEKARQGVNIQVIVDDDDTNRKYGFEYEKYFESYRMPLKGYFDNIVHHKFCVIDMNTVLHGSYNWTNKAQYNRETLEITHSREIAAKYADEFIGLKTRKVW